MTQKGELTRVKKYMEDLLVSRRLVTTLKILEGVGIGNKNKLKENPWECSEIYQILKVISVSFDKRRDTSVWDNMFLNAECRENVKF